MSGNLFLMMRLSFGIGSCTRLTVLPWNFLNRGSQLLTRLINLSDGMKALPKLLCFIQGVLFSAVSVLSPIQACTPTPTFIILHKNPVHHSLPFSSQMLGDSKDSGVIPEFLKKINYKFFQKVMLYRHTNRLIYMLTNRLIDILTDRTIEFLTNRIIEILTHRLIDILTDRLIYIYSNRQLILGPAVTCYHPTFFPPRQKELRPPPRPPATPRVQTPRAAAPPGIQGTRRLTRRKDPVPQVRRLVYAQEQQNQLPRREAGSGSAEKLAVYQDVRLLLLRSGHVDRRRSFQRNPD